MNKKLKVATAAVSVVMAGTMVFGMFGCVTGNNGGSGTTVDPTDYNVASLSSDLVDTKTVGGLSFYVKKGTNNPTYTTKASLSMNICDSSNQDRHITYHKSQIATSAVMPDGKTYRPGDLKPAWATLSQNLGMAFKDTAQNRGSDDQIKEMVNKQEQANYNIVTGSSSKITEYASEMLNLNDFIDYMPNYKAFLDENPIVKWSLTSDTTTGAMYYAPYFDGNNDIEKYVITHREWTRQLLDLADLSVTNVPVEAGEEEIPYYISWNASKGTGEDKKADIGDNLTYIVGEMGTTGTYQVDTVNPADPDGDLVKLVINYDAALATNSATKAAYDTAVGSAYTGTSGNIVDIMNAAIEATNGEITGDKLIAILRAYIDEVYQTTAGAKFYTKRSDVFNSVSAGWDVDLYTALCRCVVTSYRTFGDTYLGLKAKNVYALAGREGLSNRRMDVTRFVGELYGVRGMESRNEFTYIDANGNLQDARKDAASYDALNKFSNFAKEGLLYTGTDNPVKYANSASSLVTFSIHDYSQTQTTDGFYLDVPGSAETPGYKGSKEAPKGLITKGDLKFDFAPILTPVAKWDTNSDGTAETYMRFTESWRAVKNTGFCVPKASVQGKPEKLSAVLAFIDYLFSNDGQIVGTYGSMDTTNNSANANGFWYGENGVDILTEGGTVKTDYANIVETFDGGVQYSVKKAYRNQYFAYGNKLYKGVDYLGTQVPKLTTNNKNYYYGLSVNGHKMGEATYDKDNDKMTGTGCATSQAGNYTNYCRGIIGGALPIGNKSQGFEYQATASCGLDGSAVVSNAIVKGAIKTLTQEVNAATYWYTCVPTTLPISTSDSDILKGQTKLMGGSTAAGLFRDNSNKAFRSNLYLDVMFYGYGRTFTQDTGVGIGGSADLGTAIPDDAAGCIKLATDNGLTTRFEIYEEGWNKLKAKFMTSAN